MTASNPVPSSVASRLPGIEQLAPLTPWLLLGYVAIQLLVRLLISSNLEWDEAQFVGEIDFRLGYDNSQGPAYNWLVGLVHAYSGSWPLAVALPKHVFLAGTYLLQYDLVRRLTGSTLAAAAGAFALLLIPQIVILSEVTLAHTVMVQAAVVATLHAVVLIFQGGGIGAFVWLGVAFSGGVLAKYNYLIIVVAIMAATLTVPQIRSRLLCRSLLVSAGIVIALVAPHAVWVMQNMAGATSRMSKLTSHNQFTDWFDIPYLGIDGLLALCSGTALAVGPLWVVWRLALYDASHTDSIRVEPPNGPTLRFFFLVWFLSLALFAAMVLVLDIHQVRPRYVTPLIMAFPVWLGLAWPVIGRPVAARRIIVIAGGFAMLVAVAWPAQVLLIRGPLNYPYREMTDAIMKTVEPPFAIMAGGIIARNLAARIDGATLWDEENPAASVLVVVRDDRSPEEAGAALGAAYRPRGEVGEASFPNHYLIYSTRTLRWLMFYRQESVLRDSPSHWCGLPDERRCPSSAAAAIDSSPLLRQLPRLSRPPVNRSVISNRSIPDIDDTRPQPGHDKRAIRPL
jgi:hypothetical protein